MSTVDVDPKALVAAIRTKAAEMPKHVYAAPVDGSGAELECVYVERKDGELCGSCLVGHGLLAVGVPAEELDVEVMSAYALLSTQWGISRTSPESLWIQKVQEAQDTGTPWGRAVERADDMFTVSA